jgi:hypothetical protein
MRYFTRDRLGLGDAFDESVDWERDVCAPYFAHIEKIGAGALHVPHIVDLLYSDYEVAAGSLRNLEYAVESICPYVADYDAPPPQPAAGYMPLGQILYTEVDIVGDRFEHSLLVDPLGDITLHFSEFSLAIEPAELPLPRDLVDPPRANFRPARPQRFLVYNDP